MWSKVHPLDLLFEISYDGIMKKRFCRNRECRAELPESVHWSAMYCSAKCKEIGCHSTADAISSSDPLSAVNDLSIQRGATFVRFGYRAPGRKYWRYYPGDAALILPLEKFPPLPVSGNYRVILFDERLGHMPADEFSVHIVGAERCLTLQGSLSIRVYKWATHELLKRL